MGFKAAVVGLGSIGTRHLHNILSCINGVARVFVFDSNMDRLHRNDLHHDKVVCCRTKEEIAGADVDVAFIATPNASHYRDSMDFISRGVPVFIEKPVTIESKEARKLMDLAAAPVLVGCNMRYHPGVRKARDILQEGLLGTIVYARAHFGHMLKNWRPEADYKTSYSAKEKLGGGVLWDGIHELDYVIWLMGDVLEYHALYDNRMILDIETEEIAEIILRHADGVISCIHLDYIQPLKRRGLELVGTQGSFLWESMGKNPEEMTIDVLTGTKGREQVYKGYPDGDAPYREELQEVFDVLGGKGIEDTRLLTIELACKEIEIIESIKIGGSHE
jgi:predicted dehydrogenase